MEYIRLKANDVNYEEIKKWVMSNYLNAPFDILEIKQEDVVDLKEEEILDLLLLNKSLGYRVYLEVYNDWGLTLKERFKPIYNKYRLILE